MTGPSPRARRLVVSLGLLMAVSVVTGCSTTGAAKAPGPDPSPSSRTAASTPSPVTNQVSPVPTPTAGAVGEVTGVVLRADGTPAAGCAVDKGGGTEEAVVTDASGRFRFSQAPGSWTLRFACSKAADKGAVQAVVKAGQTTDLTVRLTA